MKNKYFVSIIWGYQEYFYNFAKEEHYHMHVLSIAKEMGYEVVVIINNTKGIIEKDPLFPRDVKVIYYNSLLNYFYNLIKYSLRGAVFYVNSVMIGSLIVPIFSRKTIFMGHTHPIRRSKLKQVLFNFSMKLFFRIRLNNEDEKIFLVKQGISNKKLKVVPISLSFSSYKYLMPGELRNDLVYFGNITEKKNLKTIIKAVNMVADKYPGIKLHLVGEEYESESKKNASSKLNLISHGFQPPEKANEILNNCLICLNSSFDEGMCVSVFNAALSGCALCLPNIMSFTGVFNDKALFHDVVDYNSLANNIIIYLDNKEFARNHNAKCREMILADYSYQKISNNLKELFSF